MTVNEFQYPHDFSVVPMDDRTAIEIEAWLDEERRSYPNALDAWEDDGCIGPPPIEGFRNNWDAVKRGWRAGASVHVLMVGDETAGFLDGTDILEVRPKFRDAGYGRVLAEFMLAQAYDQGRSLVEIGIAPRTAVRFWRKMGFTIDLERRGSGGGIFAFKILDRTAELGPGARVPYSVSWFSEDQGYSKSPTPFARFEGLGERLPDGSVALPSRAYCFERADDQHVDYFVRIELDAVELIFDKAKRAECADLGVERDAGYVFFVDRITPGREQSEPLRR